MGKSLLYIFAGTASERSTYKQSLRPLAKKHGDYLSFVTVDSEEYHLLASTFDLARAGTTALVVQSPTSGLTFVHEQQGELTPNIVEVFILDVVKGAVQPIRGGQAGKTGKHTEL